MFAQICLLLILGVYGLLLLLGALLLLEERLEGLLHHHMLLDFLLHQLQVIQHVMYSSSKEDQLEYEGEEPPSWSSSVRG
jgi:hypothetical protein